MQNRSVQSGVKNMLGNKTFLYSNGKYCVSVYDDKVRYTDYVVKKDDDNDGQEVVKDDE